MPTTVVNVRDAERGTYIYCGRPTIYGNPYTIGVDGTREDVILKFVDYFFDRLSKDDNYRQQILKLKDKKIGCWCHPKPCHLHIVAEYLNNFC